MLPWSVNFEAGPRWARGAGTLWTWETTIFLGMTLLVVSWRRISGTTWEPKGKSPRETMEFFGKSLVGVLCSLRVDLPLLPVVP
jgi:hypothetical protein